MNSFCLQTASRYYFIFFFNEVASNTQWPAAQDATRGLLHLSDRRLRVEAAWKGRNASSKLWCTTFTSAVGAQKQMKMEEHSKKDTIAL